MKTIFGSTFTACAALLIAPAYGQDVAGPAAGSQSASDNDAGLVEIVVTAEKREGTVQRSPIAISVLTAEQLARNGVGNIQDLAAAAPSVNLNRFGSAVIVAVRGVSSRDTTEIGDPAVSISIDGQYIQRAIGLSDSVFDLARVEVLRGPQGTLYGRNATGGAINFITAKPTKDLEGSVKIGVGNYNLISSEGMLNIPVADPIQLRASFFTRNHHGYRNNAPARDGDDADARAGRLHLAVQPTDRLNILLTGEYVHLGGVGASIFGVPLIYDAAGNIIHEEPALPRNGRRFPLNLPSQSQDSTTWSFRWTADYDLDFATATYLGSYRNLDYRRLHDLDGTQTIGYGFDDHEKLDSISHELRLSSKGNGRFKWQLGGFYFREKNDLFAVFRDYSGSLSGADLFVFDYPSIVSKSKAAFAQISYELIDDVRVEGGVRYTKDRKTRQGTAIYFGAPVTTNDDSSAHKWTYHAGVNWQAGPNNLLYAKIDKGYKAGGFTSVAPYGPETVKAYEIGSKNRFLSNQVQLNASAFYYDYTGQQISQFLDGQTTIFNAGASRIYGGEIEAIVQPSPRDKLDGSVSYLHARFTKFCTVVAPVCPAAADYSGNRLPQAPSWQLGGGYEHLFPIGDGNLMVRAQTRFESTTYLSFNQLRSERNGSYTRSDVIVSYAPDGKGWSVEAYIRNIENTLVRTSASEQPFFGSYTYQFADPRTFGVRFGYRW